MYYEKKFCLIADKELQHRILKKLNEMRKENFGGDLLGFFSHTKLNYFIAKIHC